MPQIVIFLLNVKIMYKVPGNAHRLNSLSILGAKLWNCLKPDLGKLRKRPFKNKIHQCLLSVLGNEDDYIDVSTLFLKITIN